MVSLLHFSIYGGGAVPILAGHQSILSDHTRRDFFARDEPLASLILAPEGERAASINKIRWSSNAEFVVMKRIMISRTKSDEIVERARSSC